jgi:hypothetical protein
VTDAGLGGESRPLPDQERTFPLRYRLSMTSIQQPGQTSKNPAAAAEAVRIQRLREDAQRPMSVNLAETIALSHALLKMAASAQRQ